MDQSYIKFFLFSSAPVLFGINACSVGKTQPENQDPNIILIMSDDQGWGDVAYNGHPHLKTPNLDDMAARGIQFNRFYAAAPVCSPTRASVLTGRHPYRMGINFANVGHLPEEELTLPEILKAEGYSTGHFGKWHLGTLTNIVRDGVRGGSSKGLHHYSPPWLHGYDSCFVTESAVPTYNPMKVPEHVVGKSKVDKVLEKDAAYDIAYWKGEGIIATKNLDGDASRVIMDRVIPFIRGSVEKNKPFFTVVWFHAPHSPVVAGKEYREIYKDLSEEQQHYYGCITAMDEQIGRLRNELKNLGVAENTMIWFCSDNGPAGRGGGPGTKKGLRQQGETGGLKLRKGHLYEGGIRVPGILEWPAKIKQHKEINMPVVTSDYWPTIVDLLNIRLDSVPELDGISLVNVLFGTDEREPERSIGFQSRLKGDKYFVWMNNQYKLISENSGKTYELYNIITDPTESQNLADSLPDVVVKMKSDFSEWQESTSNSFNNYVNN